MTEMIMGLVLSVLLIGIIWAAIIHFIEDEKIKTKQMGFMYLVISSLFILLGYIQEVNILAIGFSMIPFIFGIFLIIDYIKISKSI